jgi:YHS domain-containing protein
MKVLSKSVVLGSTLALSAMLGAPALAQHQEGEANHQEHAQRGDKPINKLCPISQEPIDLAAGTFEYKGNTIAVCCAGCNDKFMAWDEPRKDMFVKMALAGKEGMMADHKPMKMDGAMEAAKTWTEPYALDTCIVSGEKLGGMGDPIVKKYDGREVRFCCEGCIEKFEADQAGFFKKIDAKIIKDQLRYYPTQTCIVSGEPLVEDGEDVAVNMVYGNRLIRFCCKMCKGEFKEDPKKFIAKLDKAVADAQRADYPLDTCVVKGGELGSMGEPAEMVLAGRLIRFCCPMCKPKAKADPVKYLAAIDKAWQAKGMYPPTVEEAHGDQDDHATDADDHGDGHDHSKQGG